MTTPVNATYTDEEIIEALKRTKGIISRAAKLLGCDSTTVRLRVQKTPEIRAVQVEMRELLIDEAEGGLGEAVDNKESWAILHVTKTLGRNRGYSEKSEVVHSGDPDHPLFTSSTVTIVKHISTTESEA